VQLAPALAAVALLAACCDVDPPAPGPVWSEGPALPDGRRRLESGVTARGISEVVVAGGFASNAMEGLAVTNEVLALDTFEGTWTRLPDAPLAMTHINLASVGGVLYMMGGLEGPRFTARGESFSLQLGGGAWMPLPSMPAGLERGAAAVVTAPNHIYLLGGAGTVSAVKTCLDYNIIERTWTQLPDLPNARSHAAAMRMQDGTLVLAGGLATLDATQPLSDVFILRPGAAAWEGGRRSMPTARGGCAYGQALGQLICAGGESGNQVLSVVEGYDPVLDQWTPYPDMPEPRAGTQGAMLGQQLWIPGGAAIPALEPTSKVLVFSPLETLEMGE
jgi:N-acetylneuraminic acid mutarotase